VSPTGCSVFVGCCFAGALFTLLLPEVRRRDPDLTLAEEIEAARVARIPACFNEIENENECPSYLCDRQAGLLSILML
jgi:hypothetical protein